MEEEDCAEITPLLEKFNTKGGLLQIELHEYGNSCSDGCCFEYGTITTVNGVELPSHTQDAASILSQVLEHLGYRVEIEFTHNYE